MLLSAIHLQCTTGASGGTAANNKQAAAEYSIRQDATAFFFFLWLNSSIPNWQLSDLAQLVRVCEGVRGSVDIWGPLDAPTHTHTHTHANVVFHVPRCLCSSSLVLVVCESVTYFLVSLLLSSVLSFIK